MTDAGMPVVVRRGGGAVRWWLGSLAELELGGCRMLFVLTPGGFVDVIEQTSDPTPRRALPPASEMEPGLEAIAQLAASYVDELVAP